MEGLDIAAEREQLERDSLVAAIRGRKSADPQPNGQCVVCDDDVAPRKIFCSLDCSERYELIKRQKR